jgi:hypothetical protein
MRARYRYEQEKAREMDEKALESIILDYSEIQIEQRDRNWDYVGILLDTLPASRNDYAHGSSSLHNQVRGTIELAAEIINQIFPAVKAHPKVGRARVARLP